MAGKYTEAQHKATQNYRNKNAQLNLTITQEEKNLIQNKASLKGISIKKYLLSLVKNDNV
jgi:predicted DNA binding CopG/RHH family protein